MVGPMTHRNCKAMGFFGGLGAPRPRCVEHKGFDWTHPRGPLQGPLPIPPPHTTTTTTPAPLFTCGAVPQVLIDAVVHAINEDYEEMAQDFIKLGFLARGTDVGPIVPALEQIWKNSLGQSMKDFNFRSVTDKFNQLVYQYPARGLLCLPPSESQSQIPHVLCLWVHRASVPSEFQSATPL